MVMYFFEWEYIQWMDCLMVQLCEEKFDVILLFVQESMYWLIGYDIFGYCFFQMFVVKVDGFKVLLMCLVDLCQVCYIFNIFDICIWVDCVNVDFLVDLKELFNEFDLFGVCIGVEYDMYGMIGWIVYFVDW